MLAVEAEAFASFRQKWTLKLARALAAAFAEGSAAYRRPANFEAFAAHGGEDRRGSPATAASVATRMSCAPAHVQYFLGKYSA